MTGLAARQGLQYRTAPAECRIGRLAQGHTNKGIWHRIGRLAQGHTNEGTSQSDWAISSGVERHVDIVEVGGSRPPSPTNSQQGPPGLANRRKFPTKRLIFLKKSVFPWLFLGIRLYRIAFPLVRRHFAVDLQWRGPMRFWRIRVSQLQSV